MITFADLTSLSELPRFSADDVLRGSRPDISKQQDPGRVWVEVDGEQECLCFFGCDAGQRGVPLIYFDGDATRRTEDGWAVFDGYSQETPAKKQLWADQAAWAMNRPFVNLARPGVYGSSGNHQHRRRPREFRVVDAAITAMSLAFGWKQIDVVGFSGGGHLVASLLSSRRDIRFAVIASGNVAVRMRNADQGWKTDITGFDDFIDPIDLVTEVSQHPPEGIVVLTDPNDVIVSATSQLAYVQALRAAGVEVDHRPVPSVEPGHHVLREAALLAAATLNV